ncbi:glutamine amidotransferase [candidate division MSBL1 archaeon SCGC-AAA833F18]|uniref:Pyridoxal 5'-phosphate synthase subunit PdxT n=3 Tax=candidate division MSBL1 TaxID=215777 RepID=A0A133VSQ7_9EURY|nr:glutamine amidotransferase [candidate division MSBL1 archaeon SCGC-AAA261G05]KXB09457.1 glutamine amidotransferase [candidate division MSBL1 archaeon SCGC-AAA833K04]KXB09693.1 glutamine amidotransferase [candidate division MSBL1 archaeon SCGC-AAA833F18]
MRIGVIGLQGAVSEHIEIINKAMRELDLKGKAFWLREASQLSEVNGIVVPGGESTTIGRLMTTSGIFERVKEMGKNGMPILGTCAGLILLAKEGDEEVEKTGQPLLRLMDMRITRNAFGRQRESFEVNLDISAFGERPFRCVFIRAPAIEEVWSNVEVLAEYEGKIVAAKQGNLIALAFHPELTDDTRAHEYFLKLCESSK